MDLLVVLAAASLGTARVVPSASCSPYTPTGSLIKSEDLSEGVVRIRE